MRRLRLRACDERGAVLVMSSTMLTALLGMSAFVVDIAALRMDARVSQEAADFAAVAGASQLDGAEDSFVRACEMAWEYFFTNAPPGETPDAPSDCNSFNSIANCDPTTGPHTIRRRVGGYELSITMPVRDGAREMGGRLVPDIDGTQCERIAVSAEFSRRMLLGPVVNSMQNQTTAAAVGRGAAAKTQRINPSLVVLDPSGCNALLAGGNTTLLVRSSGAQPGIIVVDSTGRETASRDHSRNCSLGRYVIDADGRGGSKIDVQNGVDPLGNVINAAIYAHALAPGNNAAQAYEATDISRGRLRPRPTIGGPVTRQPVDHKYNCSAANLCPDAGRVPASIDLLRAQARGAGAPLGFSTYTGPCTTTADTPPVAVPSGNWYVPCAPFEVGNTITFAGGSVVFEGDVRVLSTAGRLVINDADMSDSWVFIRNGDLERRAQAQIHFKHTFVYVDTGTLDIRAGDGALFWTSPRAGVFADLAYWSESALAHELGGQASMDVQGVFFAPNANPFHLKGSSDAHTFDAQFFVYRLQASGDSTLTLVPRTERAVPVLLTGVRLIR